MWVDFLAGWEQPRSPPVTQDVALLQGSRFSSSADDHTHPLRQYSRLALAAMGNGSEKWYYRFSSLISLATVVFC